MKSGFDHGQLEELGFEGFTELRRGTGEVDAPEAPGVYVVVRRSAEPPDFLETSVGGHFKGRDPSVPLGRLRAKWLDGVETLYIGRAGSLRARIDQLARFGRGEPIGHWGGRLLWQLEDHEQLLVAWRCSESPQEAEADLVERFIEAHGALPYANLVQPRRRDAA